MRTIESAIEELKNSKFSKNSLAYKSAMEILQNPDKSVSTGKKIGSGSFSSSKSWTAETIYILKSLGIECRSFNSAPKGGKHGEKVSLF